MTVYVMGCDDNNLVKIGYSSNTTVRLERIRATHGKNIRVLWESSPEMGRPEERKLHAVFWSYRRCGEWFDFGKADPVALVSAAIKLPNPETVPNSVRRWQHKVDAESEHGIDEYGRKWYMNDGLRVVVVPGDVWDKLPCGD